MVFKGGVKEAANILSSMPLKQRQLVFDKMIEKDPQMATELQKYMVTIEDLIYLTPKQLVFFISLVELKDLSLALRLVSEELRGFFLNGLSRSLSTEIADFLKSGPRPVSEVQKSTDKIMSIVRKKVEQGELVLTDQSEEMV